MCLHLTWFVFIQLVVLAVTAAAGVSALQLCPK